MSVGKSLDGAAAIDVPITHELLQHNAILYGLDDAVTTKLITGGKFVQLTLRQQIYRQEEQIETVYFPLDCVLSVVTQMEDGSSIEIGTIGREGMSAFPLLMGASTTANDCYCQVRGRAVMISADLFHELSAGDSGFRQRLDRYLQAYVNMLGQLAACNRLHSVIERCSRWLLMTVDRVGLNDIPLTHEYLAMMLGTGRSGVTIAAATLQQAGLITYSRGTIQIIDRAGLESASCECYTVARNQFGGFLRLVDGAAKPSYGSPEPVLKSRKVGYDGRPNQKLLEGDF